MNFLVALAKAHEDFDRRTLLADGRLQIELHVSRRGVPSAQFFRFEPDVLTATLWLATRDDAADVLLRPEVDGTPCSDRIIKKRIVKLLGELSIETKEGHGRSRMGGLGALIQAVAVLGSNEIPGLLVGVGTGVHTCCSIPRRDLEVLSGGDVVYLSAEMPEIFTSSRSPSISDTRKPDSEFEFSDSETSQMLADVIAGDSGDEVRKRVEATLVEDPYLMRLLDFADHLLATRGDGGKMRPVKVVRHLVTAVCAHTQHFFECNDPGRPTSAEELEQCLSDSLEAIDSNYRTHAARQLRLFYFYLQSLPGSQLPDLPRDSALRQYAVSSGVDSAIILEEDHVEIVRQIERRWGTSTEKSDNRLGLLDLYHVGYRHEEARTREKSEVLIDSSTGLSEFHISGSNLKTLTSRRRTPAALFSTESRQRLIRLGSSKSATQYVFEEDGRLISPHAGDEINEIISGMTGHHAHSYRHFVGSTGLMGMMLRDAPFTIDPFPKAPLTAEYTKRWGDIATEIYGNNQETRKHAYLAAQILGHTPGTLVSTYSNLLSYLLRIALDHSATLKPDDSLVHAACGMTPKEMQRVTEKVGVLGIPRDLFFRRAARTCKGRRSPISPNQSHTPSLLSEIPDALLQMARGKSSSEIAEKLRRSPVELELWTQRATYLANLSSAWKPHFRVFGESRSQANGSCDLPCLTMSIDSIGTEQIRKLGSVVHDLFSDQNTAELARRALRTYIHRVTRTRRKEMRNVIIFRSLDESSLAEDYTNFLVALRYRKTKDINFWSFSTKQRSVARASWKRILTLTDEIIKPFPWPFKPTPDSENWFAIAPRLGYSCSTGFQHLMALAYIAFGEIAV